MSNPVPDDSLPIWARATLTILFGTAAIVGWLSGLPVVGAIHTAGAVLMGAFWMRALRR